MRVQCPNCSKVFPVTEKVAGRKAKCACGTILQMPQLSQQPATTTQQIEISCASCSRRLSVPATAVGKLAQCPCGEKLPVPAGSQPQPVGASSGTSASGFGNDLFGNEPFADDGFGDSSSNPFAASNSGFGDDFDSADSSGEYGLAAPAYLSAPKPRPKVKRKPAPSQAHAGDGPNWGQVGTGMLMMIGAVVWFVVGFFMGFIFFYPPILLIIGLFTMIKGFVAP